MYCLASVISNFYDRKGAPQTSTIFNVFTRICRRNFAKHDDEFDFHVSRVAEGYNTLTKGNLKVLFKAASKAPLVLSFAGTNRYFSSINHTLAFQTV